MSEGDQQDGPSQQESDGSARQDAPGTVGDGSERVPEDAAATGGAPQPPRVDSLSPAQASTAGGARITIVGGNFQPGCTVAFGDGTATVVSCKPDRLVVDLPPAPAPTAVDVTVTQPDGQQAKVERGFAYLPPPAPPKLISVEPRQGYCAGGTTIVVTGANYDEETVLRVGEVQASIERRTETELVAITPPHEAAETVALEVINRERVPIRLENAFTYVDRPGPTIEDVEPRTGTTLGGSRVTIEGANLGSDVTVRVGRERAKLLRARGDTVVEIETPIRRQAGLVDLEIARPDGKVAVAKKAFKYDAYPAPVVSSVEPSRCSTAGGTRLTISGNHFAPGATVLVDRQPVREVKRIDEETIEIVAPPGKHGRMVAVEVRNIDGAKGFAHRAFAYDQRYE